MKHTLNAVNVTKEIKGVKVLNGISLSLEGGKVYGLIGKNGSGKTMLFRALAGLIGISSGSIEMDGVSIAMQMKEKPNIGVIIENASLYPDFTGFQNLKLLAQIRGRTGDGVLCDTLQKVGLNPHDPRIYKKYSLGMKQRLAIAQAIMENPDFLLMDEPSNGLDPDGVQMVRTVIRETAQRGAIVLLASHSSEDIKLLSDITFRIDGGRVTMLKDKEEKEPTGAKE